MIRIHYTRHFLKKKASIIAPEPDHEQYSYMSNLFRVHTVVPGYKPTLGTGAFWAYTRSLMY